MSFFPNANLCPLKLAVKYNPPTLALFYKTNPKDRKKRRYNIFLNQLVFLPTPEEITDSLFNEHGAFLNEKNVDYEQVYKMVQLISKNFNVQETVTASPINNLQNYTPVDQLNEVNSYIESDHELDNEGKRSIEFENDEQIYFSNYQPRQGTYRSIRQPTELNIKENVNFSNTLLSDQSSNSKRLNIAISPNQRTNNMMSNTNLQSTKTPGDTQQDTFDFQNQNTQIWPTNQKLKDNNSLSLSISGMQQFMQTHGPGTKMFMPNKTSIQKSNRSNSNLNNSSSPAMPSLQLQGQLTQSINYNDDDNSGLVQSNLHNRFNSTKFTPQRNIQGNINQSLIEENSLNITNFVEQGYLGDQMLINDQTYQSPVQTQARKQNRFVQQQINMNQQFFLQQQQNQVIQNRNNLQNQSFIDNTSIQGEQNEQNQLQRGGGSVYLKRQNIKRGDEIQQFG